MKYIFGTKSQGRSSIIWFVTLGWHAGVKLQPNWNLPCWFTNFGLVSEVLVLCSIFFFFFFGGESCSSWPPEPTFTSYYLPILQCCAGKCSEGITQRVCTAALGVKETEHHSLARTDAGDGETLSANVALGKAVPCRGSSATPPAGDSGNLLQPWWQREVWGKLLKETNGRALLVLGTAPSRRVREAAGLLLSPACPKASHLFSCARRDDRWADGTLWRALKVETSSLNQYFQED